uniref:5-oxoprolinase subunit B family protein n=1 Tax=Gordonia sp. B7-2 TaxID=3420932 RepID=UPI003D91B00F
MRELPAGHDAVVLDFALDESPTDAVLAAVSALRAAIEEGGLVHVTDVIPSAHTVVVQATPGRGVDVLGVHRALRSGRGRDDSARAPAEVEIPVIYDGDDIDDVARLLDTSAEEVGRLHRDTSWRVQFMGFAPGFGYLVAADPASDPFAAVGRRSEPRTRVPEGAVAIAAGYSAVYPRQSPGGWQLLGRTEIALWDHTATPPALLAPGTIVRFVEART